MPGTVSGVRVTVLRQTNPFVLLGTQGATLALKVLLGDDKFHQVGSWVLRQQDL